MTIVENVYHVHLLKKRFLILFPKRTIHITTNSHYNELKLKYFLNNSTCDIFRNGLLKLLFVYTSGNHLHFIICISWAHTHNYNTGPNPTINHSTSHLFVSERCVGYHLSFIPTDTCILNYESGCSQWNCHRCQNRVHRFNCVMYCYNE